MCWTGNQTSLAFCVAAILPVKSQWIIKIFLKAHLKSPRYQDSAVLTQRRVKSSQRPEQTSIQENKISLNVNKQPLVAIDLLCVHSETQMLS